MSGSPILTWWQTESEKRARGEMNEIDINEIKAAHAGVKNKWFKKVKNYPDLFYPVIINQPCDWEAICALRG